MISVVNLKFCIVGYCNCKSEAQVRDIIIRLKTKPFRETKSTVSYVLKTNDWIGQQGYKPLVTLKNKKARLGFARKPLEPAQFQKTSFNHLNPRLT